MPNNDEFIKNLQPAEDYECIPINLVRLMIDSQEGTMYVIMKADDKEVSFSLNSIESTMLTFVRSGCSNNAHIKTIYQLYMDTMSLVKCKLVKGVIEAKEGDVVYARLMWKDDKSRVFYNQCSAGDALILTTMAKAKMEIVKKALTSMDNVEDLEYEDHIDAE